MSFLYLWRHSGLWQAVSFRAGRIQGVLDPDSKLGFVALAHSCDLGQLFPCSEPQLSSSVK